MTRRPFARGKVPELETFLLRFLHAGLDINSTNLAGETPLFYAVEGEITKERLQVYLDLGADMTARNGKGQGLLHVIGEGSIGRQRHLDAHDCEGLRHMQKDADGSLQAVSFKTLMDAGLDPYMEDDSHRTPLDLAAASGFDAILRLFVE